MITVTIPDALPQLYAGKHKEGTGRACIMNAIAYMGGDKDITDMPSCVWGPLAVIAQVINDQLCPHLIEVETERTITTSNGTFRQTAHKLCDDCSHDVWMMGATLIGTQEVANQATSAGREQLTLRMAHRLLDWDTILPAIGCEYPLRQVFERIVRHSVAVMNGQTSPGPLPLTFDEAGTLSRMRHSRTLMAFVDFAYMLTAAQSEDVQVYFVEVLRAFASDNMAVNDLGQRTGAHQLMRYLPTFIDWLHEVAGRQTPQAYALSIEDVAKVPVMVA